MRRLPANLLRVLLELLVIHVDVRKLAHLVRNIGVQADQVCQVLVG